MTDDAQQLAEPAPELVRRPVASGAEARVAVMRRHYDAPVEDVWDACTDPERLARWYVPEQVNMGSGVVVRCEPPAYLLVSLGGGVDEIELHLAPSATGGTDLRVEHATTLDTHEIMGETYDAVFCMGGGYYPRLLALDWHLRGTLAASYDSSAMHLDQAMRPAIERGSAAMAALLG